MLAPKYCQTKIVNNKLLCIQRGAENVDATKTQNVSAKCCGWYSSQKLETISTVEPSTVHTLLPHNDPMPNEGFPWILVRGHGPLRPANAQLPWPRGAAQPQKRGRSRLPNAAVFCLGSRDPRAKPQAEPNGTKERKTFRKFWHLKTWSFWKLWPLELLPELKEHCGSLKPCQLIIELKHTSTLEKKSVSYWDTAKSKRNNPPVLFLCSWYFIL